MKRVDIEPERVKEPVIVPRQDYEADRQRGYTILEYAPAGEVVIKNPRNPQSVIRRQVPAVLMFRCMQCQFDVIDGDYKPETDGGGPRSGIDIMKLHLFRREHPWRYTPFETPYGNIDDVRIEGVEDYTKEIE